MDKILSSIALVLLPGAICLILGCDKGKDETSCLALCEKLLSCDAEAIEAECLTRCEQLQVVLQKDAYQEAASCIQETSCAQLDAQGEVCLQRAVAAAPADALDGLISALCTKINACMPTVPVAICAAMFSTPQVAQGIEVMKLVKKSFLDCTAGCFSELDCGLLSSGEAAYQTQFGQCATSCGLSLE